MAQSRRHQLQVLLEALMDGSGKVHFAASENTQLSYPCIEYHLENIDKTHADNRPYTLKDRYQVTYMTTEADSDFSHLFLSLPLTADQRHFRSEYIYHHVFTIYF